jgi:CelD/BcsL family acetyltransferase involved in cellulose biosynthesis
VGTRLIPLSDLSGAQLGAWQRLAARAAEPNPFFEPYFALATIHRSGARGAQLLVVERDDDWLACVPMRWHGVPPVRALRSWRDEYSFLGTPLVERDSVTEAAEALLDSVREDRRILVLERLALDGPVGPVVLDLLGRPGVRLLFERREQRAAATKPPPEPPSKEARERRRLQRRLQEELGGDVEFRDRSDDPDAIEDFLRLEAESWKGRAGTAFTSRAADEEFLRRICVAFANEKRLSVVELSAPEGPPVAMTCSLVAGDTEFGFKTAFDERYRRCAPGVQLLYLNRDAFYESGRRLLDSCSDEDAEMVNRVLPDRRPLVTLIIGPSGLRGAVARGAVRAAAALRKR